MMDLPIPVLTLSDSGSILALNREAELKLYPVYRKLIGQGVEALNERIARGVHRAKQTLSDVIVRDITLGEPDSAQHWDAVICKRELNTPLQIILMPSINSRDDGYVDLAQFAHILSHEIKNPLAGISGASQMMRRSLPADADMFMLDIIDKEVKRVGRLIDRLSNFELFNAPKIEPSNIHALMEQVIEAEKAAFAENVTYQKIYDPSLPPVAVDPDHIQEAIQNLLRNAAEALQGADRLLTPPIIQVRTGLVVGQSRRAKDKRAQQMVEIRIEDNGPGIPIEAQKRVFGAFQSTKEKGRGLGLAIVKEIVAAHGGRLDMTSRVGVTRFSMILPVAGPNS